MVTLGLLPPICPGLILPVFLYLQQNQVLHFHTLVFLNTVSITFHLFILEALPTAKLVSFPTVRALCGNIFHSSPSLCPVPQKSHFSYFLNMPKTNTRFSFLTYMQHLPLAFSGCFMYHITPYVSMSYTMVNTNHIRKSEHFIYHVTPNVFSWVHDFIVHLQHRTKR